MDSKQAKINDLPSCLRYGLFLLLTIALYFKQSFWSGIVYFNNNMILF